MNAGPASSDRVRRVLLVAYDFPPRRTSGVYRPTALAKYLLQQGWQATVLTIAAREGVSDSSLLERLPGQVEVVRTAYLRLRHWEGPAARMVRSLPGLTPSADGKRSLPFRQHLRSLADFLQSSLYFPDESAGWIPFALEAALTLHLSRRFDAIYTTHPPRAAHVVGLSLRALCRLPWVAEFRDPWATPPGAQMIPGLNIPAENRNRWLLRKIVRWADAVVAVTEGHADDLRTVWKAPPERVRVIGNGFDEDDFSALPGTRPQSFAPGCVHVSHFGTIYPEFGGSFFPALLQAMRQQPGLAKRLRVHIIGFPDDQVRKYAGSEELRSVLQLHPFLGHAEALEAMRASDCLLIFYGHRYTARVCIPGKVYEYLRSGPPILALTYEGGLQQLLEGGRAGWVVRPDDMDGIGQVLQRLVFGSPDDRPRASSAFVAQFGYQRLSARVADALNSVTRHGH